jgi:cobalt-zinc-cadmium efflux system outer membrane protein
VAWLVASMPPACGQWSDDQRGRILEIPDLGPIPGSGAAALGPPPGALQADGGFTDPAGGTAGAGFGAGRRRTGRLPGKRTGRTAAVSQAASPSLELPEVLPAPVASESGDIPSLFLDLTLADDPGPDDGLSLDAAIDRMLAANLDIRGLRQELTQADADIITAGLRTNPLVYMDSQMIPYGSFDQERPGGPTQYDVNITLPWDVSGKRQARTVVARMARTSIEAQFQDVVRRQLDGLYRAFVDLQSARLDVLTARAALARQQGLLADLERREGDAERRAAGVANLAFLIEQTRAALADAEAEYDEARETMGVLLNLPPGEVGGLEPTGSLRVVTPPPPGEQLVSLALRLRPDIAAARSGVSRASAELKLQRANRFDDVYLFYDPLTIQDNSPYDAASASSWGVGLTFALPIFNRNQGNIARAESNIAQTKTELSAAERRVVAEVRLAEREFRRSRESLEQVETKLVPRARALVERYRQRLAAGDITADEFQEHVQTMAEVAQQHRESVVRHRRAALQLNTAVGMRLLP